MSLLFTIPGRLPGLNDYTKANRTHVHVGSKMKRDAEALVTQYLPAYRVKSYPVVIHILWVEKDDRRDPDNVAFAVKFILDAMVTAGVLVGDGRKHIAGIRHEVITDKAAPRVTVEIEEDE